VNLPLIIAFFGFHDSEVKGRTRIQKEICILEHRDSIKMNLRFKPYFYGPYSSKLSSIVDTLVSIGVLKQTIKRVGFDRHRYDYKLTKQGKKWFLSAKEALENSSPEVLSKMEAGIKKFETLSIPQITSLAKECSGILSKQA